MKTKLIILLTAIIIGLQAEAQQKTTLKELIGTWHVFSMDVPGEMYFNFQTDSFYVKMGEDTDSSMQAFAKSMIKEALQKELGKMKFYMAEDGIMYDGDVIDPSRKMGEFIAEKSVLMIKDKESSEVKEVKIWLKADVLTMLTEDKGVTVTMLCKKGN